MRFFVHIGASAHDVTPLTSARSEAISRPPDSVFEPIPTRAERNAWTPDQRHEQQKLLGQRYELLRAWWVRDPAMLLCLDDGSNRTGKPNENFAREVMELFTLGEGRYTQRNVVEAARAYTGWSLDPDMQAYVWRAARDRDVRHDEALARVHLRHAGPGTPRADRRAVSHERL
ncbi:hypothetical protein OKW45_004699 [Paraburkholderia sp. WSM4175]